MSGGLDNVIAEPPLLRLSALLARLEARYPAVPRQQVLEIVLAEHDAITGGTPIAVPVAVETAAAESLQRRYLPAPGAHGG